MNKDELKAIYFSFFDQLKPEHAEKAKANYDEHYMCSHDPSDHYEAINWGFIWSGSPEGEDYWDKIHDQLGNHTYPLQLTPQVCKDKAKAHMSGSLPSREWFKQLKPEHQEAALELDYEDDNDDLTQYISIEDALHGRLWGKTVRFQEFWHDIHQTLRGGTYHLTERMATDEDYRKLDELTAKLPADAAERKEIPVYSGCVKYFGLALAAVARLSKRGNDQHNPGTPLHWDRSKSGDELDAMMRHVIDGDWTQVAWRALANLQKVEEERISNEK